MEKGKLKNSKEYIDMKKITILHDSDPDGDNIAFMLLQIMPLIAQSSPKMQHFEKRQSNMIISDNDNIFKTAKDAFNHLKDNDYKSRIILYNISENSLEREIYEFVRLVTEYNIDIGIKGVGNTVIDRIVARNPYRFRAIYGYMGVHCAEIDCDKL